MRLRGALVALGLLLPVVGRAEDTRTQYPAFLQKAYFEVGVGSIHYPFSARQLEPGFSVESVSTPHAAARVGLLGYRFNDHLAAQINYMRPVEWVRYKDINGYPARRTVWMNLAGFTLRGSLPLSRTLVLDAEAGPGLVTRKGFRTEDGTATVIEDASFWTVFAGGGLRYKLSEGWELAANALYAPSHEATRQPHTLLLTGGFRYNMRPLSEERVAKNAASGHVFPRNLVQLGYATDNAGYGVNRVISQDLHVFWGGLAQVRYGFTGHYQRNVFHTRRTFALDVGASVGQWKSRVNGESFTSLSAYPLFRFTLLRSKPLDFYLNYSLAGPTMLSRAPLIDGYETGRRFTFQDFMGAGFFVGKSRRVNAEVRIGHYSNGNLFPENDGVSIPLTFNLGYTFD